MRDLAIIIPAYKIVYLETALQSLADQTNKDFTVYVGDDCSPFPIKEKCDHFSGRLNLNYHRFETNLGSSDLVGQWHRCVELKGKENWLWLFSDDDIAEAECVEKFYAALISTKESYDVYRFNTSIINNKGEFVSEADQSPELENPMSLAYNILLWKRGNSMPDHIFRYSKYLELNGFVNFPFAQASDWATSINFSYPHGLFTIAGPKIKWRMSGDNVSSLASSNKKKMIFGHLQFIDWINKRFTREDELKYQITKQEIESASIINLKAVIFSHYKGIPYTGFIPVVRKIARIYGYNFFKAFSLCVYLNYRVERTKLNSVVNRLLPLKHD